jgi:hypothetical protein
MLRCVPSVVIVAALLAAGCGKTSVSTSTATAPAATPAVGGPAQAHFIARAEKICARLKSQERRLSAGALKGPRAASLLRRNIVFARAADAKLEALTRPTADAASIEQLLTGFNEEVTAAGNFADALANKGTGGQAAALSVLGKLVTSNRAAAASLGLKACAASE